jgi:cobalt/nickel transport protein
MTLTKKLWIGIFVLIILTPLGLILPDYFKAGGAWGENKLFSLWDAPLPDYSFKGWQDKAMLYKCFAYVIAAIVGIAVISGIVFLLGRILAKNNE